MILLPLISLGFLILFLVGVLISFQYYTHYQSLILLERTHIAEQRQRAQTALGILVAFSFAAVISLCGIVYPALSGFVPEPIQPQVTDTALSGETPTQPTDQPPENPPPVQPIPTEPVEPTNAPSPTQILPMATIGNTGGVGANIRSIPGLGGTVIEVLDDGERVILLEETREVDGFSWQFIEMQDTREGWVVTQFLIPDN
jgi:hypothetical protein